MPVDDKLFNSEVKRLDSDIKNANKSQEKFETKVESAIYDLRRDMKDMRQETTLRFERIEVKMDSNFRWLIGTYITLTGIILAAFYAFASLIR
jgi:hypothetical protein